MSWIFLICSAVMALGRLETPIIFRKEPILYSRTRCLTFAVSTNPSVQKVSEVSCTICPAFSSKVNVFRTLSTLFSMALSLGMAGAPDVCPDPQEASVRPIEVNAAACFNAFIEYNVDCLIRYSPNLRNYCLTSQLKQLLTQVSQVIKLAVQALI